MEKQSAGILLYRVKSDPEVFLVHMGGPYFNYKREGWWTIPNGEPMPGEALIDAAWREFEEETGYRPVRDAVALSPVVQKGGKKVHCWAVNGDLDPSFLTSNKFELEWPPQSEKIVVYPEINEGRWFEITEAKEYINSAQVALLEELEEILVNKRQSGEAQ